MNKTFNILQQTSIRGLIEGMKKQFFKSILQVAFLSTLLAPVSSWAIFEVRGTYGLLTSSQSIKDICQGSCTTPSNAPAIIPTYGMGADAILKLPLIPFGFGVRYEKMSLSASSSTIEASLDYTRTAAIVNYRLIDTIVHFGPIFTYGLSHTGSMSIKESNNTVVDLTASTMSSYSAGLELEVKPLIVLPLIVGVEAGYMGFTWSDAKNSKNSTTKNVDLSGTYAKVFIGLDI